MNRQQFESLKPSIGHTAVYKIFAMQSDHFLSQNDVGVDVRISTTIPPYLWSRIYELIDTLSLYSRLGASDEDTYLRLILNSDSLYHNPNISISYKFCCNILAIRPDFVRFMPARHVNVKVYLQHIKEWGVPEYIPKILPHLENKEFLFYVWKIVPDLLIRRNIFTRELLAEFLQLHPECIDSHSIYDNIEPVVDIPMTRKHILKLVGQLAKVPIELLTPDIVLAILETNPEYMLNHKYRGLITQELFDKYLQIWFEYFPKYVTRESVAYVYQKHKKYDPHHIGLYSEEIIHEKLSRMPSHVIYVDDPRLLHKLLSRNESLTHYIPPDMLLAAQTINTKSARS